MNQTKKKSNRHLFGCHLSTWLIVCPVILVWILVTVPGLAVNNEVPLVEQQDDQNIEFRISHYNIHQHGWPYVHLERITGIDSDEVPAPHSDELAELAAKWLNESSADRTTFTSIHRPIDSQDMIRDLRSDTPVWGRSESWKHSGLHVKFYGLALLANVLIGMAMIGSTLAVFEWRRRNRERVWQFSIVDILFAISLVALGLQYWITVKQEFDREAKLMGFTNETWREFKEANTAPIWLKKLVAPSNLKQFDRIVMFTQNGFQNDPDYNEAVFGFRQLKRFSIQPHPAVLEVVSQTTVETLELQIYRYTDPLLLYQESSDASLAWIPNLKKIKLNGMFPGHEKLPADRFFTDLANAEHLETFEFRYLKIAPADIAALGNVGSLKRLNIVETQLTDELAKEIAKLKQLEILELKGTPVTNEQLALLKDALPQTRIFVLEIGQREVDEHNL